jgi:sugar lactone lactonase YvrE
LAALTRRFRRPCGRSAQLSAVVSFSDSFPSYAFDVMPETQAFANRRVFAFIDESVPDGLTLDTKGNLYVGCGDGTQVGFRGGNVSES